MFLEDFYIITSSACIEVFDCSIRVSWPCMKLFCTASA